MKHALTTLALASAATLFAVSAYAADDKAPSPATIEQLNLVNKLIALGDARKDPILLMAAASLQKSMGMDEAAAVAKSTAPDDVLERAKALSGGRKDLTAIVDDLIGVKSKGASWRIDAVSGKSTYRY
jgi:hypothetical protein